MLKLEGRLPVKVYYEDTDSLGVVYYANYLKYFERGRSELFAAEGASVAEWNAQGYLFAVFKANLTFAAPAKLWDECEVFTSIVGGSPVRLRLEQRLMRDQELLTHGEIQLVCLDPDLKVREFPAIVSDLLQTLPKDNKGWRQR